MKLLTTRHFVGLALVGLFVVAILWMLNGSSLHPASVVTPAATTAHTIPIDRATVGNDAPTNVQLAASPVGAPTLMQGLNGSTNYRAFISLAKKNVESGGAAYAMWAMAECSNIHVVLTSFKKLEKDPRPQAIDSRNIVARAQAQTLLESRCGVLMEHETDIISYQRELQAQGKFQSDPLLNIGSRIYDKAYRVDPDARRQFVEAVLASQDPLLWMKFSANLIEYNYKTRQVYFDGQMYDMDKEPALMMATVLAACGLGLQCDAAHDLYVAQICWQLTICEHDRFELVRRQSDAQGIPFVRVMSFYHRIVAAFHARSVAAFVPS